VLVKLCAWQKEGIVEEEKRKVPLQVIEAEFSSSDEQTDEQRMQGVPKGGVAAEESGFRTTTADRHAQKLGLGKVYQVKQPLSWQGKTKQQPGPKF